jgi:hypothetical protein
MVKTISIEFQLITISFLINILLIQIMKAPESYQLYINNFCLSINIVAIFIGLRREFSLIITLVGMSIAICFIGMLLHML